MLVGYARVSTQEQDFALQLDALKTAGCNRVFEEKASGAQRERPALKAALEYMRQGDTLVVWRLDRFARSLKQLIETVESFGARDVGLRSLTEAIDTTTVGGKLVFHIFAALAEFERGVIRERTLAWPAGSTGTRPHWWQAPCPQGQGPGRGQGSAARSRDHRGPGRQAPGCGGLDPLPPSAAGADRGPGSLSRNRPCQSSRSCATSTRSTGHRSATGSASSGPRGTARSVVGRMARPCSTWAMAAGGTRRNRPGGTAEVAGPLACPGRACTSPDNQGGAGSGASRSRSGPLWP